jgi:uncharacterized membrane protein YdjX (TVP38/TMEM64 family)
LLLRDCAGVEDALATLFIMSRVYDFINLIAKLINVKTIGFIIESHIGFIPG